MSETILANRYQIQQQLGKHAGRETHLAKDLETNQPVVVKLLKFGEIEWQQVKLFEREAQTLQNLDHPSIPRYLDYFEIDLPHCRGFVLVQSYINALSLQQQLADGRNFTEEELIEIATSLLEILIYLHNLKPSIIHRDLKPSNILLTNRSAHSVGDIYLVDFGSVKNLAATTGGTITIVGTYGYMPPEQFGDRTVPASDLYALGATIINLATGKPPADLPQRDGKIFFESVVSFSPHFSRWLSGIIQPSLDQRYKSATEALKILQQPHSFSSEHNIISKPSRSRIILKQSKNTLKINIPFLSESILPRQRLSITLIIVCFLISRTIGIVATLSILLIVVLLFLKNLAVKFLNNLNQFRLILNRQKVISFNKINYFYNPKNEKINKPDKIIKIERIKEVIKKNNHCLIVYSALHLYTESNERIGLFSRDNLSEEELEWLTDILSNWLNLPVNRRYIEV